VLVLLTSVAHDSFGDRLDGPGLEWLILQPDGTLRDGSGSPVGWEVARPEVAWGTSDLFRAGAPVAAFFDGLIRLDSLRWFQSPAAGSTPRSSPGWPSVGYGSPTPREQPAHRRVRPAIGTGRVPAAGEWRRLPSRGSGPSTTGARSPAPPGWWWAWAGSAQRWPSGPGPSVRRSSGAGARRRPMTPPTDGDPGPAPGGGGRGRRGGAGRTGHPGHGRAGRRRPAGPDAGGLRAGQRGPGQPGGRGRPPPRPGPGVPAAAVLDVFRTEPLRRPPVLDPPVGADHPPQLGRRGGRLERQAELFAENLARYRSGAPLAHDVTDEVLAGR